MNSKHKKTLQALFATPTSKTLEWARIESLLMTIECKVLEGNGSRVRFLHGSRILALHRPHPAKEAKAYQVVDVLEFLKSIGDAMDASLPTGKELRPQNAEGMNSRLSGREPLSLSRWIL